MYRKVLAFDKDSFVEVSSRITGDGEQLMLSIRGRKSNNETTVASILLNDKQATMLKEFIAGWTPETSSEKMP
jgi:hypothetical protein